MARSTSSARGARTPVPVKARRTFGDVVRALLAFLALACLVVGVPLSLARFIGWPLPTTAPSPEMLQDEITTGVFLNVLAVLVWLAWAQFTACVLVEIRAALSGVGIPRRVPGAGPSQLLARQLVGALLLLSSAAASFAPGVSQFGSVFDGDGSSRVVAEAEQTPGQGGQDRQDGHARDGGGQGGQQEGDRSGGNRPDPAMALPEETGGDSSQAPTKYYRIQPPDGRHHDTLWGIAERHLDDGLRYKEIYQLNKDRVQPDGSRLTEASLIRPGWILEMPADAHGGDLVEMPDEQPELSEEETEEYQEYQETGDTRWPGPGQQPGGPGEPGGPDEADEAEQPGGGSDDTDPSDFVLPDGGSGGQTLPGFETVPPKEDPGAQAAAEEDSFGLSDALTGAPLLAAGLLVALGRTRRHALWQTAAGTLRGRSISDDLNPEGRAADARDALLAGAAPQAVAFLDRALRLLSAALDADGRVLPPVYAAWLGDDDLHLQLASPAGSPPSPWQQGQSETYWTLDRAHLPPGTDPHPGGAGNADAEAPYPGLVSLGVRDGTRLLLNLEAVPGIVSVTGAPADREAVLASIAAELATSGWSDRMTVTLVGFGADLPALAPTRVRHLEDIAGLLEVMETETGLRRGALQHTGQESVLTGRTGPARRQQWAPHLVLIGAAPTDDEAERLAGLAAVSAPLGIGYLVSADRPELPGIAWEFEITSDGRLSEPVMGLQLEAQLLPATWRAAVVDLFAQLTSEQADDGAPRAGGPAFLVDLTERGKPEVYVQLMGGYEITGLPDPGPERGPQLKEALALLLLHREGVHPRVLASALWPRGVPDDVRDALLERLRTWLGTDGDGTPRLAAAADGRLALSPRVVSDWDVLRTLHHRTADGGQPVSGADRTRQLTDALGLARGDLLEGSRAEGRYAWLDHEIVDAQYPLLVAGIALALSAEQLAAGDSHQAYTAVRSALAAAPADERLWNELLRAAHATGRQEWLTGAADWLVAHHRRLYGPGQGLPARTQALLDELLPAWRGRQAG